MSKVKGINRKKLVPFILSIFIFSQNPIRRIFEKQTERKFCRRDSGRSFVLAAGSTEGGESFVPEVQEVANVLLGLRGEALSRLRAAAIAQ